MIEATLDWIKIVNNEFDLNPKRVLDVGSKGKSAVVRKLFPNSRYLGIDIAEGPNVDEIVDAYCLDERFVHMRFDAVLCLHLLEHTASPWLVLEQIDQVLINSGYLYAAMPTVGYPIHNHPSDYWRATEQAMREVIMEGYEILSLEHCKSTYGKHPVINCLGRKRT